MKVVVMNPLRRLAGAAAGLGAALAAGSAFAHPGHGAELLHSHGDMALGVGALALAALGAGLVVAGKGQRAVLTGAALRQWGWRLAGAGVVAGLLLVLTHG